MLVGQPELWDMLARPELRQLRQRIVLRHRLRPFTEEETAQYVEERLRLAGYTGKGIFKKSALRELHAVSGGTPRVINIVCDGALLLGFGRDRSTLGPDEIREVASDLGLEPGPAAQRENPTRTPSPGKRNGFLGLFRRRQTGRV
jgi:general secretion pathway protein A